MERSKIKVIYGMLFKPLTEPMQGNEWKGQRSRSWMMCCSNLLQSPGKAMNGKIKVIDDVPSKRLTEPRQGNEWKGQRSRSYMICCSKPLKSPGKTMNGKVKEQVHKS